jgi:hypothetical protein
MGYQTVGHEGFVTSWGSSGDDCFHLLGTGFQPYSAKLTVAKDAVEITPFVSGGVKARTNRAGLGSWSVDIEGRFPRTSPKLGNQGLITFAGGYVLFLQDFELNLDWGALEITQKNGTGVLWKAFRPGILQWGGTYEVQGDSATNFALPELAAGAPSAATIKLTEEGGTDNNFTGSIQIESLGVDVAINQVNRGSYAYTGSGDLTVVGSSNILPSGVVEIPDWDSDSDGVPDRSLVFQAASGRTFTGPAFIRSIRVTVPTADYINVSVTAQGAGSLTLA